jgi:hypothetical protein
VEGVSDHLDDLVTRAAPKGGAPRFDKQGHAAGAPRRWR